MLSQGTIVSTDLLNGDADTLRNRSAQSTGAPGAGIPSPQASPSVQRIDHIRRPNRLGTPEVLLATLTALTIYTTLLLRLPYRSPVLNSVYSILALSAFYLYLRLRIGIRVPALMLLCLVLSIVLDVIGNQFGLFSRRILLIPYDTITHFTSSALSFVPVMWLLTEILKRFEYRLPLGFVTFFSATTTFSLAAYYEITELIDERVFGGQRIWTPRDTVQDLAADLCGIVIAAVACNMIVRKRRGKGFSRSGAVQ